MIVRRTLMRGAAGSAAVALIGIRGAAAQAARFPLKALPYSENALAPAISAETVSFHYGKHHKSYVDNLNKAVQGTEYADWPLDKIVKATHGNPALVAIYNNAAQVWNHEFYWHSMGPKGGGQPSGIMAARLKDAFGDYAAFRKQFVAAAASIFGSGWAWLVQGPDKKLAIATASNAETPMAEGMTCLLGCDVWEHSYYLDYQNRRAAYADAWLDKLANWEHASNQLSS